HGDLASTAEGKSIETRDNRLAKILDQVEDGLATMRVLLRLHGIVLLQLANVRARNKRLFSGPGKNHDTNFAIVFELREHAAQFAHGGHVQRIENLWPVDGDVGDLVFGI